MRRSAAPSTAPPNCCTARPAWYITRARAYWPGSRDPFVATRYHSLTVLPETVPDELEVTGRTESGIIMAMQHRTLPIHGVQFHPESVLTQGGHRMLANWLEVCGARPGEALVARLEAEVGALTA